MSIKEYNNMLINERKLRSIVRSVIKESLGGPDQKHAAIMTLKHQIRIASPKSLDRMSLKYDHKTVPEMSLKVLPMSGSGGCARAKLVIKSATNKGSLDVCLYDDRIEIIHNDRSTGESEVYFTQSITPEQIINGGASKLASDIVRARAANWYYQPPQPPEDEDDYSWPETEDDDEAWENDPYKNVGWNETPNPDDDFDDDSYDEWENDDSQLAQDNRYARELANKADETSYEEELAKLKARYGK